MLLLSSKCTHKCIDANILELLADVTQIIERILLNYIELWFEIFLFPLLKWLSNYQVERFNKCRLFSSINDLFAYSSSCSNNSNFKLSTVD